MSQFEAVIGLEVHAQLGTDSKIFAPSATPTSNSDISVGDIKPNIHTDPVTLGLPGCLPVLNRKAVDLAIRLGIATDCEIRRESIFARKHYFYPDLPKGYQISQYDKPICMNGKVTFRFEGGEKTVRLTRIHLEEDAGKSSHAEGGDFSEVDLNRAGVPLVEIVSEPDIRSASEAATYMKQIRQVVQYLDVCDGNMEEGNLRCDANVSIRKIGTEKLGTKVEIKNLNSFRFVEKAINYEIERQEAVLISGELIVQETRLWDDVKGMTRSMRSKEQAEDYRYFPDPDLLPLIVDTEWVERVRSSMPELPSESYQRFKDVYGFDDYMAGVLTEEKLTAAYFDQAVAVHNNPENISNWVSTELFGRLNKEGIGIEKCPVSPEQLGELVQLIDTNVISGKIAKTVFDEMFISGNSAKNIINAKGLTQISDNAEIEKIIKTVLAKHPTQVVEYRGGKTKTFGFFVGQVMKECEGRANPASVNEILKKILDS